MTRFLVTFDVITPESADRCDIADSGFVDWRGNQWSTHGADFSQVGEISDVCAMGLGLATDLLGVCETCDGFVYYECDGRRDYRTGVETRFAFHLPRNATPSSVARIRRLLKARKLIGPWFVFEEST